MQAWREKLALVLAIAAVSGLLAFLTFGFSDLVCERVVPMSVADIRENFGVANPRNQFVIVRGRVHGMSLFLFLLLFFLLSLGASASSPATHQYARHPNPQNSQSP